MLDLLTAQVYILRVCICMCVYVDMGVRVHVCPWCSVEGNAHGSGRAVTVFEKQKRVGFHAPAHVPQEKKVKRFCLILFFTTKARK